MAVEANSSKSSMSPPDDALISLLVGNQSNSDDLFVAITFNELYFF